MSTFNEIIQRAEITYGVILILFLLTYIAFYRKPHDKPDHKK